MHEREEKRGREDEDTITRGGLGRVHQLAPFLVSLMVHSARRDSADLFILAGNQFLSPLKQRFIKSLLSHE